MVLVFLVFFSCDALFSQHRPGCYERFLAEGRAQAGPAGALRRGQQGVTVSPCPGQRGGAWCCPTTSQFGELQHRRDIPSPDSHLLGKGEPGKHSKEVLSLFPSPGSVAGQSWGKVSLLLLVWEVCEEGFGTLGQHPEGPAGWGCCWRLLGGTWKALGSLPALPRVTAWPWVGDKGDTVLPW